MRSLLFMTILNNNPVQMNSNHTPLHDSKIIPTLTMNSNSLKNTSKENHFGITEKLTRGLNQQVAYGSTIDPH